MMTEFKMPSLGADMEAGTLVEWLVKPGDEVHRGDIVAVVETDKGAIDVEIFEEGIVEKLLVRPVTKVPVGAPLALLRTEGEEEVAAPPAAEAPPAPPRPETPAAGMSPPSPVPPGAGRAKVSPRARKLAEELGVDPETIAGTGPGGAVTAEDVQQAARAPEAEAPVASRMRAAIAAAMSRSKREIPHYYLAHTVDLEPALQWLERTNVERPITERILPVVLLVRAVAFALRDHPQLCGWWRDGAFVPSSSVNVGVAVSLRDGGLVNPAVHEADRGSLGELMTAIRDVTQRARTGQLRSSELGQGAITVTSMGDQGVPLVFGVIHPPQVALVGTGTIATRPWVVEDGSVVGRRVVDITLSGDHRATDGHLGARFLRRVDKLLQAPESL